MMTIISSIKCFANGNAVRQRGEKNGAQKMTIVRQKVKLKWEKK